MKPPAAANKPYRWLADHYDTFFAFHREWFQSARNRILAPVWPHLDSACDLACGTGAVALTLAARGLRTYAVDLSPRMCRLARAKARARNAKIRVIQADMRDFQLPTPVGLVLCNGDALNHLPSPNDLPLVLRSVARSLHSGGYFFFDVNNRKAFETLWPQTTFLEAPGVAVVMRGSYDRPRRRGIAGSDWFLQDPQSLLWRRHHERVEEVCWTPAEIRSALRAAGFSSIRAFDSARFAAPGLTQPGCRTFYLARLEA